MAQVKPVVHLVVRLDSQRLGSLEICRPVVTYRELRDILLSQGSALHLPNEFLLKLNDGKVVLAPEEDTTAVDLKLRHGGNELHVISTSASQDGTASDASRKTNGRLSFIQDYSTILKSDRIFRFDMVLKLYVHSVLVYCCSLLPCILMYRILYDAELLPYIDDNGMHHDVVSSSRVGAGYFAHFVTYTILYASLPMFLVYTYFSTTAKKEILIIAGILDCANRYLACVSNMYSLGTSTLISACIMNPSIFLYVSITCRKFDSNFDKEIGKLLIILVIAMLGLGNTGIIQILRSDEVANSVKVALNVFVVPVIREIGYTMVRSISRTITNSLEPRVDIAALSIYSFYLAFITRFLFSSLDTYTSITTNLVLTGLVEIILRQTHRQRDKLYYKAIHAVNPFSSKHLASIERFWESVEYREHCSRIMFLEMETEFIAILTTPIIIITYHTYRFYYDFGYTASGGLDYAMLAYSLIASLLIELTVDALNVNVEITLFGFPIEAEWNKRFSTYAPLLGLTASFSFMFFMAGYRNVPPDCPNTNYFCMCYRNLTYSLQIELCDDWLVDSNNGSFYHLNASEYGFGLHPSF